MMMLRIEKDDGGVVGQDGSQDQDTTFARACANKMHMDKSHFLEIYKKNDRLTK